MSIAIKTYLTPSFDLKIFGVAGPSIYVEFSQNFEKSANSIEWNFYTQLEGGIDLKLDIFSLSQKKSLLKTQTYIIDEVTWKTYGASTQNNTPFIEFLIEPDPQTGCYKLSWHAKEVDEVYLDGEGVTGHFNNTREVCEQRIYTLRVVHNDGNEEILQVSPVSSSGLRNKIKSFLDFLW